MGSPFAQKVTPAVLITERQLDFLFALQRDILATLDYSADDVREYMHAYELQARQLGRQEASVKIDEAKEELRLARARRAAADEASDAAREEGIEGFWELPDGAIVKVQIAVHGSGKPYGKLLNTISGSFDYNPGILTRVRKEGTRLTLERAKELGQLYGLCIRCGATLTDEASIAAGIGPICATKF